MKKIFTLIFSLILIANFAIANSSCLTCNEPSNVIANNSDSLGLKAIGNTSQGIDFVNFEYGPKGFAIGSGTNVTFDFIPSGGGFNGFYYTDVLICNGSGYDPYTYEVYGRYICSSGDTSSWTINEFTVAPNYSNFTEVLDINNITATFSPDGSLFQKKAQSSAGYQINNGPSTIYAANLWFGGTDSNNQLKLAAQTYGMAANDSTLYGEFYPGPIGNCDSASRNNYNRLWKITQTQIDSFYDWYQCGITPGCTQDPNYVVPEVIMSWPGNGYQPCGHNQFIAPFNDTDLDGVYEPGDGETPCIKGDMALFNIYNDKGLHANSGGDPINIEVRAMHYAFNSATDSILNNTIFSDYAVINNGPHTLSNFKVGIWEDMDIGCPEDDYVGTDVSRGMIYTYNADAVDDGGCGGAQPFGANPPAQGMVILNGILMDDDGVDNPLTNDVNTAYAQNGIPYDSTGCGYGDAVVDNERIGMSTSVYYDRTLPSSIYGDPQVAQDYYNYMNGIWRDGTNFVYGGSGNSSDPNASNIPTNFCFPGDSDPLNWGTASAGGGATVPFTNWSESSPSGSGSTPNNMGDRRVMAAIGPTTLNPFMGNLDNVKEFSIAHITAFPNSTNSSVDVLKSYTDHVKSLYGCDNNGMYGNCTSQIASNESPNIEKTNFINIYPNPTNNLLFIRSDKAIKSVSLYDISGKQVLNKQINNSFGQLDITRLKNGVYILHLLDENQNSSIKQVIKN